MNLEKMDILKTLQAYESKAITPSELVETYLQEIEQSNSRLNAFLELRVEAAKKRAKELDSRLKEASTLPLFGIPIAIKDNFLVTGWKATAGSKILHNYLSPYTATSVQRLEDAGAIVIGKTNCDEFAMGSSNENSAFGNVRNPWDSTRVPGGSSGGSAAAVAASLALGALGTDTGGSIRQPASLCGVVGLKPSYGRVSRYGVVAYASSLDQVGPFGKTVWDTARILEVMAGHDRFDSTSSQASVPKYTESIGKQFTPRGVRVGVASAWLEGVEPGVQECFSKAIDMLRSQGAKVIDISLPHSRYAVSTYYLIAPSEASSNLARYDGVHYGYRSSKPQSGEALYFKSRGEGFGREVKLRIMLGTYALSAGYYDAFYLKANQMRRLIQKDFEKAFSECDLIAVPTSPSTAFKLGEKTDDPIKMYLSDIFTLPVNLAGLPGISIPCGLDKEQLPVGMQLIGKPFDEMTLFHVGHAFEMIRGPFSLPIPGGKK
ncbi:MAG: Asp-tRNA(Asn)/Glu-tRNA(Gln) amidotransferase subunit GatA [Deltaproteobacteria bacterium]|nr:Asp-tRNA(Asn)/Glu-tRNA(Gln) amidotransferase subunit GatA [Deltaproteobacteria bacterium]